MEEFIEPKQIDDGMKQGLARMYGDTYMRSYLLNAIAIAKKNAIDAIKLNHTDIARDYVSRATVLEQLLEKGKQYFVHFEEIARKLKEPLKEKHAKN